MKIRSTVGHDLNLDVCGKCHPFFTGKNQFVDTEGRIDKFQKRFGTVRRSGGKPKLNK